MDKKKEMDIYSIGDERTLNVFIDSTVKPDRETLQRNNAMVDRLVNFLENNVSGRLQPRRVIKSGSFGKGTAVRGKSDIDLILMLAKYDSVDKYTRDSKDLLQELKTYLTKYGEAQLERVTRYSVQVTLTNGNFSQSVDVLLGVDLLDRGMVPDHVFDQMQGPDVDTHLYSVTLGPMQVEVMKALPTQVKDLIRIVKYWEDVKMKAVRNCKWPSSFAMELVVMHAWNNAGSPQTSFSMVRALHAVLTSLVNHRQFKATFPSQMKYSSAKLQKCLQQRSPPYIMDPTNPYNDMYHGLFGNAWDWDDVAKEAGTWSRLPLFRGVTGTHSRWQ